MVVMSAVGLACKEVKQSGILLGLCSSAVKRFKAVWLSMCSV